MNVKRYFAATAREALRALKAELGADAIVLSNRAVEGGVEILALPADEVGAVSAPPRREAAPAPATPISEHEDEDCRVSLGSARSQPAAKPAPQVRAFEPPRMETPDYIIRKRGYEDVAPQPARPAPRAEAPAPRPAARVEPVIAPSEPAPVAETVSRHLGQ